MSELCDLTLGIQQKTLKKICLETRNQWIFVTLSMVFCLPSNEDNKKTAILKYQKKTN